MWITKLQLSNIKSYGPDSPVIHFRPGVNLIQGSNGAGKSTILEAIGLALFDSRPYNLGQFVREGVRSGSIMVGFMSALDEREYEVVRQVGSSSQAYVHDPELKRKLCEGKEDTLAFVRQHLNLDAETNLTTLFEDAIGVPQGTMTAVFRERPGDRKPKFNRLLHIDMYERAWNDLLKTGNYIKDLIQSNAQTQAELRGALRDRPGLQATFSEQAAVIVADEAELTNLQVDLATVSAALAAAEALKRDLDALDARLVSDRAELAQAELRLKQARDAVADAEAAAGVVEETSQDHLAYEQARQALDAAEVDRRRRDGIQRKLSDLMTRQSLAERDREQAAKDLAEVVSAEAEMARLDPLVQQQSALQAALDAARAAEVQHEQLARQVKLQQEQLDALGKRVDAMQAEWGGQAGEGVLPSESGLSLADLVRQVSDAVSDTQRVFDQWVAGRAAVETAGRELETLRAQFGRRFEIEQVLRNLDASLQEHSGELARHQADQNLAQSALQQLAEHEVLLSETGATCPVCRQPVDAHAQAEAQAHYAAERQRLTTMIQQANEQLASATACLASIESERDAAAAQLAELPVKALVTAAEQRFQAAETKSLSLAEQLGVGLQRCEVTRRVSARALERDTQELGALAEQIGDTEQIRADLDALGEPRQAYDLARHTASRRADLDTRAQQAQQAVEVIAAEREIVEGELAQFADLDSQIADLRSQIAAAEAGYTRYVASIALARQLESRKETADRLSEKVAVQTDALHQLEDKRIELARQYDAPEHEALRTNYSTLDRAVTVLSTRLDGNRAAQQERAARLAELDAQAKTLEAAESEAGQLSSRQAAFDFIRQTVRDAGPQITGQLVRVISEQANHIFGDLLGDHSYILTWSEDYGISVNSRGEVREFELLSGGEQMMAAMAVRLALLTQLANVRFAFFDEPTTNLDDARRNQLAASLASIHSLQQLFVISHDDTFEQESYHVIQVYKENDVSQVEIL